MKKQLNTSMKYLFLVFFLTTLLYSEETVYGSTYEMPDCKYPTEVTMEGREYSTLSGSTLHLINEEVYLDNEYARTRTDSYGYYSKDELEAKTIQFLENFRIREVEGTGHQISIGSPSEWWKAQPIVRVSCSAKEEIWPTEIEWGTVYPFRTKSFTITEKFHYKSLLCTMCNGENTEWNFPKYPKPWVQDENLYFESSCTEEVIGSEDECRDNGGFVSFRRNNCCDEKTCFVKEKLCDEPDTEYDKKSRQ